jgi:hypothetical protein
VAQHIVVFDQQIQNVSQGLFPDGNTNTYYFMTNATPRGPNTLGGPLQFTTISITPGGVILSWSTIGGHRYQVEFKNDLDASPWTPLGEEVSAVDTTSSTTDTAPVVNHRFYRVVRLD